MTVSTSWNIFGDFDHLGMIWFRLRLHKLFCWRNSRCRLLCKWYRLRPPWLTKLMHQTFFPVKSIMVVGLRISLISSFCFPGKRCHLILLHDASVFMIVIEVEWRLHVGHHFTKKSWTFSNMLVGLATDHHFCCLRDMPYCVVKQYNISDKDTCRCMQVYQQSGMYRDHTTLRKESPYRFSQHTWLCMSPFCCFVPLVIPPPGFYSILIILNITNGLFN